MNKLEELTKLSGAIEKAEKGLSALVARRNEMIVNLSQEHSLREIAVAARMSHPTVMRIIRRSGTVRTS